MKMTLLIPENDTLITYFLLPLLGLNKKTFGRAFRTSYLNNTGRNIFVELSNPMVSPIYKSSTCYVTEFMFDDALFVNFEIPQDKWPDIVLFMEGKYSQMSKESKKQIYSYSTLAYNQTMDDFKVTHPILHALGKTKRLRNFLVDFLDVDVIVETQELIDNPDESWFIEYRLKHGRP
jgi:hypothetical protein